MTAILKAYEYNKLHSPFLNDICAPVIELGFSTFFYSKLFFRSGYVLSLCTDPDWKLCFWQNLNNSPTNVSRSRFISAINESLTRKHYKLLNLACDKEEYSDTYNTISNFDYKESSDGMNAYVEYWGFGYLPQLRDAVEFYINNEILFRNFLNHFKYETRHVTLRAERQRMFYYLDNFFVAEHESTGCISSQQVCVEDRKDSMTSGSLGNIRPKRIDITHNNVNLSISYRQFQCLCYVSSGYSFKEVASLLGISSKSVEFHIYKIKETTRCRYKSDLIEMVKKNNLNMCLLKS